MKTGSGVQQKSSKNEAVNNSNDGKNLPCNNGFDWMNRLKWSLLFLMTITFCFFISDHSLSFNISKEPDFKAIMLEMDKDAFPEHRDKFRPCNIHNITFGQAVLVDRKRYLCPRYVGRLGNIMFIYASSYGLAVDNNLTVVVSPKNELYKGFQNIPKQGRDVLCERKGQHLNERFPRFHEKFKFSSQETIFHVKGYLQSWKYFKTSFSDIKYQFTFKSSIQITVRKTIRRLIQRECPGKVGGVTTVGIHVRREDFIRYNFQVGDKAYFERAKRYFMNKWSNVLFIIATTSSKLDRKWCEVNLINGTGKTVFSGLSNKYEDMAMLSLTDHVVISVGTFSWWAGFLNNGTVIYYDWIPEDHPRFNRKDFLLPSWIGFKPSANNSR